jgi:antitoxin ParD1/3/4
VITTSFSPELQQLVREELATGGYASEDELLLQAVRLLADRNRQRQELRRELQIGRDQLDRGEGIELDSDEALGAFLDEIEAEVNAEAAAENKSP